MESCDGRLRQRAPAHQLGDTLPHLGGSFIGESDRENGIRRDVVILHQIGDAVGDDARLP